jgi:hypothetical protein
MNLDTRGFMDGALRGYEVMENHNNNKKNQERADEQMAMQKANHAMSLRNSEQQMGLREEEAERSRTQAKRSDEDYNRLYGEVGEDGLRSGGTYQEDRMDKKKLTNAQLNAAKTQQEVSAYNLSQAKRSAYIQENLPIIQNAWARYDKTGELDDILQSEFVAGGAYDPRRYESKQLNKSFDLIESKIPEILNGKLDANDPEFIEAMGIMWEPNIKASVGQKDPITGKEIKDAKLGGVTLAKDIDPNTAGDQAGIVLTTLVNYGDGKWIAKPITSNRSTDPNDSVKVIPLDAAMKDITSQLRLRKQASTSQAYKNVFDDKDKLRIKELQPKIDDAIIDLEKERAKLKGKLDKGMLTEEQYESSIESIDSQINSAKQNIVKSFSGGESGGKSNQQTNVPMWTKGDPEKIAFVQELKKEGFDVGSMSIDELDDSLELAGSMKLAEEKERNAALAIEKVNQAMSTASTDGQRGVPQQAPAKPTSYAQDPRRGAGIR